MLKQQILKDLQTAVNKSGYQLTDIVCTTAKNPFFGDYTTNIALQLAKLKVENSKQTSKDIANKILGHLSDLSYLSKAEVAGNGFINLFIKNQELVKNLDHASDLEKTKDPRKILIEYGHTNPLKEVHIGHLRTFILGESLARILESQGHEVFRANYQGDVGLHIAKAIWGIKKLGLPTKQLSLAEKAKFLGRSYAQGNLEYEQNPESKKEIDQINIAIYENDPSLKEIYQLARSWSLNYFDPIYQLLGIKYDRCFFESEVYEQGKKTVLENLGKVFAESDGAIIFPGQKYGLHNRVFVTSAGNSTYEGKEIGLAQAEYGAFNYDLAIHVVGAEQEGYFQVVIKAIEELFPYLKGKKYHLSYGMVDLKEGKMSSRSGNVVTVDDLYHVTCEKVREVIKVSRLNIDQEIVKMVALGAIKFAYLKFSPTPNMIFDLEQSVSLEGDSGPYLQYTFARIQSLVGKSCKKTFNFNDVELEPQERSLLRQLVYFPDVVSEIATSYHPNLLASYLVELARLYNLFYQGSKVLGSEKENFRLKLSKEVGKVLEKGLKLLGIEAPKEM